MFLGDSGIELEGGSLRIRRIFQLGRRRRTATRRGSCSTTKGEDYEFTSNFNKSSCDEEEEYQPIPERKEEEEKYPYPK